MAESKMNHVSLQATYNRNDEEYFPKEIKVGEIFDPTILPARLDNFFLCLFRY